MTPAAQPDAGATVRTSTLVIGGGLLGCAIAYYLAKAGVNVLLAEKSQINSQASGRNAGSLHFQLEYRMIEHGLESARKAAEAIPLHLHAQHAWSGLAAELQDDLGVVQHGGLMVAETGEQVERLEQKVALERAAGLQIELLDRNALRARAPYLSPSILAAAFCPGEGKADPRRSALAYARAAARLGARICSATGVRSLRRDGRTWRAALDGGVSCLADNVVLAAGVWSGRIAQMAGVTLPVSAVGLTMAATARAQPFIKHLIQHAGRRLSMKQTPEGNVLIGGGWPATLPQTDGILDLDRQPELLLPSLAGNLNAATAVIPAVGELPVLRVWTGATALVSDQLPLIGALPKATSLFIATGGSAFTLGPTYAQILADDILGRAKTFDSSPYDPKRFGSLTFA